MVKRASIKKATIKKAEKEGRNLRRTMGKSTADSFVNYALNIGQGTNNALSHSTYGFNPITLQRPLLDFIYRGSWLGGMAIDLVADDMTRSGIELHSTETPDDERELQKLLVEMKVWSALNDTIKWSRLYGGALAVILIDGQKPETPLRIEAIGKGQFKGLMVLDRWMVDPDLQRLVNDLGPSLGLPEFYKVTTDAPTWRNANVHHSRCIRLTGIDLPYYSRVQNNLWGLSVLERIYDRMVAFDSATQGAAQLVYKSYLRTYAFKGLRNAQAEGGGDAMTAIQGRIEMMRKYQSIEGVTLIDSEDKFEASTAANFSGIADALLQFGQQLSGALQIPLVRFFGQSPAGLNSTGDSDLRTYYDGILQSQENMLREGVTKVLQVASKSKGITLKPEFSFNFVPLWQLNESEKSEISSRDTDTVLKVEEAGLISPKVALQELSQMTRVTARWSNISPEVIDAADDQVEAPEPDMNLPDLSGEEGVEQREGAAPSRKLEGNRSPSPDGSTGRRGTNLPVSITRALENLTADAAPENVNELLLNPPTQLRELLSSPVIDRTHHVRWLAVASSQNPGVTYIDCRIPRRLDKPGLAGLDPALPLAVHEQWERYAMYVWGMNYLDAHEQIATPAEKAWIVRQGFDWATWEAWTKGILSNLENQHYSNPPPDPHVDPAHANKVAKLTSDRLPYSVVGDLQVTIEQPKDSVRRGNGWSMQYAADYGYVRRVGSAEGPEEWLDCFVGPDLKARDVWIVDSIDPASGQFDEHKLLLGFNNARDALKAFNDTYRDYRKPGAVTHLNMDSLTFKQWLAKGDKNVPFRRNPSAVVPFARDALREDIRTTLGEHDARRRSEEELKASAVTKAGDALGRAIRDVVQGMPAPVVNVTVPITMPKKGTEVTKVTKYDSNGRIQEFERSELDDNDDKAVVSG